MAKKGDEIWTEEEITIPAGVTKREDIKLPVLPEA